MCFIKYYLFFDFITASFNELGAIPKALANFRFLRFFSHKKPLPVIDKNSANSLYHKWARLGFVLFVEESSEFLDFLFFSLFKFFFLQEC